MLLLSGPTHYIIEVFALAADHASQSSMDFFDHIVKLCTIDQGEIKSNFLVSTFIQEEASKDMVEKRVGGLVGRRTQTLKCLEADFVPVVLLIRQDQSDQ